MKAIDYYLAAWNCTSSEKRHHLLTSCLAADATYLDPHIPEQICGLEAINALIERFRARFDHQLKLEGKVDAHHNVFRLRWRLERDNEEVLSRGLMVGELSTSGAIARIINFVDINT